MRTSLDHLPSDKREQLAAVVRIIRERAPAEMIILFGSHARGTWVEDPRTGYSSDFDILIIVASHALAEKGEVWAEIEDRAEHLPGMAPVNLIAHDFKFVNSALESGQYFFTDIVKEGILLHDSGAFTLTARRRPTPLERKAQAEEDFEHWFSSAGDFYAQSQLALEAKRNNVAAFELHQAAERYLTAFCLTFTAYKPRIHNLEKLVNQAASLHPEMRAALPRAAGEDRRLFDLLKKAYIEARYSKKYRITAEELATLRERVRDLGERVERACCAKIEAIGMS
jgi:HEPN domain-containing protein/predicted nucleotidyltransferase